MTQEGGRPKVIVAGCTELGNHIAREIMTNERAALMGIVWSPELAGARKAGWCSPDPVLSLSVGDRLVYADPITFDAVKTISERWLQSIANNDEWNKSDHGPDLIIQCWRSDLFPKSVLEFPKYCLGIHPTPLRFGIGRGAAALNHTLIEMYQVEADELPFWENAIFVMESKPDTGMIAAYKEFKITYHDNMTTLLNKVAYTSRLMVREIIDKWFYSGFTNSLINAPTGKIMSYPRRQPSESEFKWDSNAMAIVGLVKASGHPYSGAYFANSNSVGRSSGERVYVWDAYAKERMRTHTGQRPGQIVNINGEGIEVTTGDLGLNVVITSIGIDDAIFIPSEFAEIVGLHTGEYLDYTSFDVWS